MAAPPVPSPGRSRSGGGGTVARASAETVTSGTENEGNMLTCVVLVLYRMGADREIQYDRIGNCWTSFRMDSQEREESKTVCAVV